MRSRHGLCGAAARTECRLPPGTTQLAVSTRGESGAWSDTGASADRSWRQDCRAEPRPPGGVEHRAERSAVRRPAARSSPRAVACRRPAHKPCTPRHASSECPPPAREGPSGRRRALRSASLYIMWIIGERGAGSSDPLDPRHRTRRTPPSSGEPCSGTGVSAAFGLRWSRSDRRLRLGSSRRSSGEAAHRP